MSQPLATFTVQLPHTITGTVLMAAVKSVAEAEKNNSFYFKRDGEAYLIGQVSHFPYKHVLVAPTLEIRSVRLDGNYKSVVVMSHAWRPGMVFPVPYSDEDVEKAVHEFGEALRLHLSS
jgi:hypothetical protein